MYTEEYRTSSFKVSFLCLTINAWGKLKNEEKHVNQDHKKCTEELHFYYCSLERHIFIKRKVKKDFSLEIQETGIINTEKRKGG